MRGCARFLALLGVLAFIVSFGLAALVVNLLQVATERAYVKQAVSGELVRANVVALTAGALEDMAAQQGVVIRNVPEAAVQAAVAELIPPEWAEEQTEAAVDAVYDYLESGDAAQLAVQFDLAPILPRLQGEPGARASLLLMQSLPPCPPAGAATAGPAGLTIDSCLPAGVSPELAAQAFHQALATGLEAAVQQGADTSLTVRLDPETGRTASRLAPVRARYRLVQRWAWLLWLIPLACLGLVLVLAVRGWRDFGRWWGWPLLLGAGLTLPIAFALWFSGFGALTLLARLSGAEPLFEILFGTLGQLAGTLGWIWLRRILWQAGTAGLLGLLLLGLGAIAPAASGRQSAAVRPPSTW